MIKKLKAKLNGDIHLKEILTGSAITFVLKISGMFLGYIVILIISRQYGAEGVGVYNLTLSLITFVAMIASMGMNISILRYVGQFNRSGEEHKLKLLYRYSVELVIPFSLLLTVLLYFFADVIAIKFFNNPIYEPALKFAAVIVPFMALQNISVEFIRGLKQLKVSEFLRSVSRPIINITLLLIISIFLVDQLVPLYTLGIGIVVSAIFAIFYIIKRMKKIETKKINDFSKKELLFASMPMMVIAVSSFLMGNISLFMLEMFSTTGEVGIFSISLKISALVSLVLVVVNTMSAPKFSELYWKKEYNQLQNVITHSTNIIFYISLFISIGILMFSEAILNIFGKEFITGNTVLVYLIIGQLFNSVTGSVGILLNMTGYEKVLQKIILIVMFVTIILNYFFIPIYGMIAAAIVSMLGAIFVNVSAAYYVKIKLNFITYYMPYKNNNKDF